MESNSIWNKVCKFSRLMAESPHLGSGSHSGSVRIGRVLSWHKTYCGCFIIVGGGARERYRDEEFDSTPSHHHIITSI